MKIRKIIYQFFPALFVFIAMFFAFNIFSVQAGENESLRGWMWGGTEEESDSSINGNETGVGWISLNNLTDGSALSYGVKIPEGEGPLSGYAWSENLGFIDFGNACTIAPEIIIGKNNAPAGSYWCLDNIAPDGKTAGVLRTSDNKLIGWARVAGIADEETRENSGGWSGWLEMRDAGIDPQGNVFGYAWNQESLKYGGLGWLVFHDAKIDFPERLIVCPSHPTILKGNTLQLNAYYKKSFLELNCLNKSQYDLVTNLSIWSSSKPGIVSVNSAGLITGVDYSDPLDPPKISATYTSSAGKILTAFSEVSVPCIPNCDCLKDESLPVGEYCSNGCEGQCGPKSAPNPGDWQEVVP